MRENTFYHIQLRASEEAEEHSLAPEDERQWLLLPTLKP